jgi:hypothetical protein
MAEQLEILDVRVGSPRASLSAPSKQRLDLTIDVRNNSKTTLHAITSVRSLDYDAATQTLFVGLSEPELAPGARPSTFIAPHTTTIAPKKTETISVSVPAVINKLIPSGGQLGMGVESVDVSGVQTVKFEVAYGPTPFYPKSADSPANMSQELRSWGKKAQKTLVRSAGADTKPGKPPRKSREE